MWLERSKYNFNNRNINVNVSTIKRAVKSVWVRKGLHNSNDLLEPIETHIFGEAYFWARGRHLMPNILEWLMCVPKIVPSVLHNARFPFTLQSKGHYFWALKVFAMSRLVWTVVRTMSVCMYVHTVNTDISEHMWL